MRNDLSAVLITVSLLLAVWSVVLALLNRRLGDWLIYALGLLEILLVAQLVVAIVTVAQGDRPPSTVTFLAYAAGVLLIAPAGLFWALAEKSRSSLLVIAIACLAIPVMTARMLAMWSDVRG